ncbi:hypothetical protein SAMN05444339_1244 [Loktanella atrilutea]|uniref:Uncharacterized protein n=1 Tax=Loktanella atrilutea TaxID=366533 RepID=A0A1M5FR09_LOKAT|nr:hypothetical protein SAMN05444339_1244 [Loktanella atrilutea]
MTSPATLTATQAATPSPCIILTDLVRLLAREAARVDFATGCTPATREQ